MNWMSRLIVYLSCAQFVPKNMHVADNPGKVENTGSPQTHNSYALETFGSGVILLSMDVWAYKQRS